MNNLSLLIYLAEVLPNLSSVVGRWAWLGAIATFAAVIVLFLAKLTFTDEYTREFRKEVYEQYKDMRVFWPLYWLCLFVPLLLVSELVPSKETIYLIAGSEAGEAVVTSEEGKEILNDIHEVIKHQLSTLKGANQ